MLHDREYWRVPKSSAIIAFLVCSKQGVPYDILISRLSGISSWERGIILGSVPTNQITELLVRWSQGESEAREELVPLVYCELRRMARHFLAKERPDHTLQSAALVHEAYLRLVGHSSVRWDDRVHFFAVAAQLMRRILVDHARKHGAAKRGDGINVSLDEHLVPAKSRPVDVVALDDALNELAHMNPAHSRIIELRFFAGLSIEETAQALGVSPATIKRDWAVARAWLYRELARTTKKDDAGAMGRSE